MSERADTSLMSVNVLADEVWKMLEAKNEVPMLYGTEWNQRIVALRIWLWGTAAGVPAEDDDIHAEAVAKAWREG